MTLNACPAIVNEAERDVDPVFAVTLYVTVPPPVPELPDVMVTQEAALAAVQLQPLVVLTVTVPEPLPEANCWLVGVIDQEHGVENVNGFDTAVGELPPGPSAVTRASYETPQGSAGLSSGSRFIRILPSASGEGFPRLIERSTVVPPASYTVRR